MEYDSHISIEPISTLEKPDYSLKEIHIESINKKIKTPFKVLSGSNIDSTVFNTIKQEVPLPILENGRFVYNKKSSLALSQYLTTFGSIERVSHLNSFFKIRADLWDKSLTTISLTFEKNPFNKESFKYKEKVFEYQLDWEDSYPVLLDYIHDRSKAFILTPDFRLKNSNISIETYIQYIENSLELLSKRNKRPIFAPLQIELGKDNLNAVLSKYSKLGVTNLWINFCAHPCDTAWGGTGILRTIRNTIDKYYKENEVTLYYSHIKKEISPSLRDVFAPASDILTMFNGADIIGVDRDPIKSPPRDYNKTLNEIKQETAIKYNFRSVAEYELALHYHKNRIFDPNTYYYFVINGYPDNLLFDQHSLLNNASLNQFTNSYYLYSEIEKTRNKVEDFTRDEMKIRLLKDAQKREELVKELTLKKKSFVKYLKTKKAIEENEPIRNMIVPDQKQSRLNLDESDPIGLLNNF
jgi:hypothetical protein